MKTSRLYLGAMPLNPTPALARIRHSGLTALLFCATILNAQSLKSLSSVWVYGSEENRQTDASTVVAAGSHPLRWGVEVQGSGLSDPTITAMPVNTLGTGNNSNLNPSQHNGGVLGSNKAPGSWEYGSPDFNTIGFPVSGGAADRNTRFPYGTYTIAIPGFTNVSLNYQLSADPIRTPLFALTGGSWSGGVYYIDPTQPLTISSAGNAHNGYLAGNVSGAIGFGVYDFTGNTPLFGSETLRFRTDLSPGANYISYTINPNTLTAGENYQISGTYVYITDQHAVNGSQNGAFYASDTYFMVTAIPEPSTYATILGALGLVGAVWSRTRRT